MGPRPRRQPGQPAPGDENGGRGGSPGTQWRAEGTVGRVGSLGKQGHSGTRGRLQAGHETAAPSEPLGRAQRRVCPEPVAAVRRGRGEAPPPAGARRAQANKAPLRTCRPPSSSAGPAPRWHTLFPPPRQRAPCVPPPCAASQAPGNPSDRECQGSVSRGPNRPDTQHPARSSTVHAKSPQSRKQRF